MLTSVSPIVIVLAVIFWTGTSITTMKVLTVSSGIVGRASTLRATVAGDVPAGTIPALIVGTDGDKGIGVPGCGDSVGKGVAVVFPTSRSEATTSEVVVTINTARMTRANRAGAVSGLAGRVRAIGREGD